MDYPGKHGRYYIRHMKKNNFYTTLFFFLLVTTAHAQHHDTPASGLSFAPVMSALLSDTALRDYKMESSVMTIPADLSDTVAHRHEADLFGYVLQGEVQIALNNEPPVIYHAGEMFYEKKNVLHNLLRNNLETKPAKILLIVIIKSGAKGYVPTHE